MKIPENTNSNTNTNIKKDKSLFSLNMENTTNVSVITHYSLLSL